MPLSNLQISNYKFPLPPVLEYDHVSKRYGGRFSPAVTALDDFSLSVNQGEIFGFLGPNGAGKTTAIHLAMGFMRPTAGHGQMLGKPFGDAKTRRRIGFLAESVALYHRKATKVVRFYGAYTRQPGPFLILCELMRGAVLHVTRGPLIVCCIQAVRW